MLVDTNVFSELLRKEPDPQVLLWFSVREPGSLFTCATCRQELLTGLLTLPAGKRRDVLLKETDRLLEEFQMPCLPYDGLAAALCADVLTLRRRLGVPIHVEDAQIAAVAIANGMPVVTRNVADFSRIPELKIINPFEP